MRNTISVPSTTFFPEYYWVILQTRNSSYGSAYRQSNWYLCSSQNNMQLLLFSIKSSILAIIMHTELMFSLGIINIVEQLNHYCSGCSTGDDSSAVFSQVLFPLKFCHCLFQYQDQILLLHKCCCSGQCCARPVSLFRTFCWPM